ncbi:MAG: methyltransferase domain-containing protein [Ktedonobacterales bacterium]|nr:methyltransferase domain-containing protein [Ktedonobacterales bacterium]
MPHHTPPRAQAAPYTNAPPTTGNVLHWATRYDWLVQSMTLGRAGRLRQRMADLMPLQPGNVVLDIGCGTGDLALRLARRVGATGQVIGVDPSPEMIARARAKAQRHALALDFRVEAAEHLTIGDQSVDYAVSSFVFHHLPREIRDQALAGIARVLKPTGQLLIIDFLGEGGHVLTHGAQPTDSLDLLTMLRAAGLPPIEQGGIPFFALGMPSLGFVRAQRASA